MSRRAYLVKHFEQTNGTTHFFTDNISYTIDEMKKKIINYSTRKHVYLRGKLIRTNIVSYVIKIRTFENEFSDFFHCNNIEHKDNMDIVESLMRLQHR